MASTRWRAGKQRGHNLSITDLRPLRRASHGVAEAEERKLKDEPNQHGFEQPTEKIIYDVNVPENIIGRRLGTADGGQGRRGNQRAHEAWRNGEH